jgi:hypothetical protein
MLTHDEEETEGWADILSTYADVCLILLEKTLLKKTLRTVDRPR